MLATLLPTFPGILMPRSCNFHIDGTYQNLSLSLLRASSRIFLKFTLYEELLEPSSLYLWPVKKPEIEDVYIWSSN